MSAVSDVPLGEPCGECCEEIELCPQSGAVSCSEQVRRDAVDRVAKQENMLARIAVQNGWPTPNNCRRIAASLDMMMPARYGDILRAYADAEDRRFAQHGPVSR